MIDKSRISHDIDFFPLTALEHGTMMKLLAIRNQEAVRRNMYTSHEITEAEHLAWVEKLRTTGSSDYYAIFRMGNLIGAAGISNFSEAHKRADWAFYISQELHGGGIGASVEYHFLNWCFHDKQLWKLNCEVLEFNQPVIRLHQKFGFQIEGVRRDHIMREGQHHGAVLLGVTRDEWAAAVGEKADSV